jgi:hypothetical protein
VTACLDIITPVFSTVSQQTFANLYCAADGSGAWSAVASNVTSACDLLALGQSDGGTIPSDTGSLAACVQACTTTIGSYCAGLPSVPWTQLSSSAPPSVGDAGTPLADADASLAPVDASLAVATVVDASPSFVDASLAVATVVDASPSFVDASLTIADAAAFIDASPGPANAVIASP